MTFSDNYFLRYKNNPKIFNDIPNEKLKAVVVIPCYNDNFVFNTLESLNNAMASDSEVEVIIIVNSGENTPVEIIEKNRVVFNELKESVKSNKYKFRLLPAIFENIPHKSAGVGNARKLGMDEAVRRFSEINNPKGIIISLDADSLVDSEYFTEIFRTFENNSNCGGMIFQYQHDFNTKIYSFEIIEACKLYEIYLRYFRLAVRLTGFPNYFHTIGSCFAVYADSYVKTGGMSRRQGGEDFYFLHKLAQMTRIGQINKPIVFPSPRISERVPFGTGPTVKNIITNKKYEVYNFELFDILQKFYGSFQEISAENGYLQENIPNEILNFIGLDELRKIIVECNENSQSRQSFIKRLHSKFDAFFIIKFLNSFKENSNYPPMDVIEAAICLLSHYKVDVVVGNNANDIYKIIFELDKKIK